MAARKAGRRGRDERACLLGAFEARGWRELKLEERIDHSGELERRPGLALAFERAPNERPERLAVTNDSPAREPPNPVVELSDGLRVIDGVLNADARRLGWALVGLEFESTDEPEIPALTGYLLWATFAPLGRPLGSGGRGGRQQIADEIVLEILSGRCENKGPSRIANELNARGVRPPRGRKWWPSTVQAVLRSDYAQRLAAAAGQGPSAPVSDERTPAATSNPKELL